MDEEHPDAFPLPFQNSCETQNTENRKEFKQLNDKCFKQ